MDADERVTNELKNEIIQAVNDPSTSYSGYLIKRVDYFLGSRVRFGGFNQFLLRLALKDSGEWRRRVHEIWKVSGRKRKLRQPLIHLANQSLNEEIRKINSYFEIHASENYLEGKKASLLKINFVPASKFLASYLFKLGLLDKEFGFVKAMLMSFHSFLSWAYLWQKQKILLKKSY